MSDTTPNRIDALADSFESAWRNGLPASVETYLQRAPPAERSALLRELVRLELEYRLRAGQAICVEQLLAQFPELEADRNTILDLIALEFRVRLAQQDPGTLAEYCERFPAFRNELATKLPEIASYASKVPGPEIDFLAPAQQADEIGRLGTYRVLKVLGKGGMGIVFLADDPKLDRKVALKVMLPALAANPSAKHRFLREGRAAAKVKSDHIVTIYEVSEDRGVPFLTMELLEGMPLDALLKPGRQLTVAQILRIGRDIASGLAAAHDLGLIHRDIKPANLWLDRAHAGRVKILDFGLARSQQDDVHLTQFGAIVGTPAYMAPEQARAETPVDARADLFSLGCVIYRLCAGSVPFNADTTMGVLLAVATNEPVPPIKINDAVPRELSDLIMKLLEKDPTKRPASAREVVDLLAAIPLDQAKSKEIAASHHADTVSEMGLITPREQAKTEATPRRPIALVIGGIVIGLIALLGGIYFVITEMERGGTQPVTIKELPGLIELAKKDPNSPSRVQTSLRFDGDGLVEVAGLAVPREGDLTIEAYFTPIDEGESGDIVAFMNFGLLLDVLPKQKTVFLHASGTENPDSRTGRILHDNQRIHVAGVKTDTLLRLYIDGKFANKVEWPKLPLGLLADQKKGLFIGRKLSGLIDEVRISKIARYRENFTPEKRFESDQDTIALYHVDERQGNKLTDSSDNGHHGKIVGATWVNADGSGIATPMVKPPPPEITFDPEKPLPPGAPFSHHALVARPAKLAGVESWTVDTRNHRGEICQYSFDREGKRLATASNDDSTIRIWDAQTGALQRVIYLDAQYVGRMVWTPNGKALAVSSHGLRLYDPDSGRMIKTISEDYVSYFAWSPDGTQIGIVSEIIGELDIFEMNSGKWERIRKKIATDVRDICWSAAGKWLAVRSESGIKILDALNYQPIQSWDYPFGRTTYPSMSWSPDEKHLAGPEVWSIETGKSHTKWGTAKGTRIETLSTHWIDSQTLFMAGLIDGEQQWIQYEPFAGVQKTIVKLEFSQDNSQTSGEWSSEAKLFAKWGHTGNGGRNDSSIFRVKDWSGKLRYSMTPPGPGGIQFSSSPSGKHVALTSWNDFVRIAAPVSGKELYPLTKYTKGRHLKWSSDGTRLFIASNSDGPWAVFDVAQQKYLAQSHDADIQNPAEAEMQKDGAVVAMSGFPQYKMRTWDLRTNRWRDLLLEDAAFRAKEVDRFLSNGGTHLALYDPSDGAIRMWNITTGKELPRIDSVLAPGHTAFQVRIAWSPDNRLLAIASLHNEQTKVAIWDMNAHKAIKKLNLTYAVNQLVWSNKEEAVLLHSYADLENQCFMTIWPIREPEARTHRLYSNQNNPIRNIQWTADGKGVYATRSNIVFVFDVKNGVQQSRLDYFSVQDGNWWLITSPEGHCRAENQPNLDLIYVVRTDKGQQVLTPEEFASRHGWRNDPTKAQFTPSLENPMPAAK